MAAKITQEMLDRYIEQVESEPLADEEKRKTVARILLENTAELGSFARHVLESVDSAIKTYHIFADIMGAEGEDHG